MLPIRRTSCPSICNRRQAAFHSRLVLAATLGATYGIYGPPFETFSTRRSSTAARNIWIPRSISCATGNGTNRTSSANSSPASTPSAARIRRCTPTSDLRFYPTDNEQLLFYGKTTPDLANIILVVVNLDPHHTQSGWVRVPLDSNLELRPGEAVSGPRSAHRGTLFVEWRSELRRSRSRGCGGSHSPPATARTEQDFDYFSRSMNRQDAKDAKNRKRQS